MINLVENLLKQYFPSVKEIVSGNAFGIDQIGETVAKKLLLPVTIFKPRWEELGKKAGFIRNAEMAQYADGLICVHERSSGSLNMIENMRKLGKEAINYEVPIGVKYD